MKLIKDYDSTISYYPGKANVVADALSRKSTRSVTYMRTSHTDLLQELGTLGIELEVSTLGALLARLVV